jgi:Ca2+-binding RTX toxin-like protein
MSGGKGNDLQHGGPGNDVIFANLGQDETWGGDGNDNLWAMARGDVTGPNDTAGDKVHGEGGNDVIHVRDGEVDQVDCGDGYDVVIADTVDIVAGDCERTLRRAPQARQDKPENDQQTQREESDRQDHR